MDFIRSQLLRIQQQLGGLSASQKMLTATLVTIMVMTLMLWTRYSSQSELEVLLDQPLSLDDIANIKGYLSAQQVNYSVQGDRILVPADRRYELLADLGYAKLLPRNTQAGMISEITKQMGVFTSQSQNRELWNKNKEIFAGRIISNLPNVSNAAVIIDAPEEEFHYRPDGHKSTAMVNIVTKYPDRRPDKVLANAAADIIAGGVAGLDRSRVKVVIDGVSVSVHEADTSFVAGDILEMQQTAEKMFATNITDHLNIPGAMVYVTVALNTQSSRKSVETFDPKNVAQKERSVEERSNESTAAAPAVGEEPGAGANVGASIPGGAGGAGAGGDASSESESKTEFENRFSSVREEISIPGGEPKILRASVRIPRSYFVNIVRAKDPKLTEPDDAILDPVIKAELPKIRDAVKACTSLASDDDVIVQDYIDVMPMLAGATPATPTTGMSSMLGGYSKEIAVGALAVVSLFMVLMMVRKGAASVAPVVPQVIEHKPAPQLAAAEAVAGEVSEGNPLLDGMELDEDAVKTQQMLNQVTTMVEENPDAAANLVKRWLNRS